MRHSQAEARLRRITFDHLVKNVSSDATCGVGCHPRTGARVHHTAADCQYLEEADQLADTVAVIDHGRILTNDTPANLKNQLGREPLDIKLADPADMTRIPMLRMKALPTEIQNGALSFALSEGESGLREAASILQQLMASRVGFLYDFCYGLEIQFY